MTPSPGTGQPTTSDIGPYPGKEGAEPDRVGTATPVERAILDYIIAYLRSNTYQPSIREIAQHFAIASTRSVSNHLSSLQEKGFIERRTPRSRGLRLKGIDLGGGVSVPLFRQLPSSGRAIQMADQEQAMVLDPRLGRGRMTWACVATGKELAVLGVDIGDYVVFSRVKVEDVMPGKIVAASIHGRPGYFRAIESHGRVCLEPLVPNGSTRDLSRAELLGEVMVTVRRFDSAPAPNLTRH